MLWVLEWQQSTIPCRTHYRRKVPYMELGTIITVVRRDQNKALAFNVEETEFFMGEVTSSELPFQNHNIRKAVLHSLLSH